LQPGGNLSGISISSTSDNSIARSLK
jgi:hypothetical protein